MDELQERRRLLCVDKVNAALAQSPKTMARNRQCFVNQLWVFTSQRSIRCERATPDAGGQNAPVIEIAAVWRFRRIIRSSMGQLHRCATRGRHLPNLPGALRICIKKDSFAISGPGRDLGSARHGKQAPWSSSGDADEPDLT